MGNLLDRTTGFGTLGLELTRVQVRDKDGADTLRCACGDALDIAVEAVARKAVKRPNLGYAINSKAGALLFSVGILNHDVVLADLAADERCRAVFKVMMNLAPGSYALSVLAADNDAAETGDSGVHHDTRERLAELIVTESAASRRFDGISALPLVADHALVPEFRKLVV